MANPVLPLFDLYPPQERYELSSGIRCDVPYVCRGADLLVLHGSAELSKVVPLLAGQRYQPVSIGGGRCAAALWFADYHDRSEEHTSELQALMRISYAVFCLNKKDHPWSSHKHVTEHNAR